jgi:hypothetical protein
MKKSKPQTLVVADTSGLVSLLVDTDANYPKALALSRTFEKSQGAVILSSHVFTELMNVLGTSSDTKKQCLLANTFSQIPTILFLNPRKSLKRR